MCQVQSQQGWHAEATTKLEVIVHLLKTLNIVSSSTRLNLQTIHCLFTANYFIQIYSLQLKQKL